MLEIAVLGLLKEQDMHGYELKKRLSDVFGLASAVSFGSLYPALSRLEVAGAISAVQGGGAQERRSTRRRKVYGITARGAEMFEQLLTAGRGAGEDERSFNLRLAFARYLSPEARLGLLEERRALLGQRLAHSRARARTRRDDRYMRILFDRQQEALSRDVSWLDGLIREERLSAVGAGPLVAAFAPTPLRSGLVPLASASQLQRSVRGAVTPAAGNDRGPLKGRPRSRKGRAAKGNTTKEV